MNRRVLPLTQADRQMLLAAGIEAAAGSRLLALITHQARLTAG